MLKKKFRIGLWAMALSLTGLALLTAGSMLAADKAAPPRAGAKKVDQKAETALRTSSAPRITDRQFAHCLMIDNQGEIAVAEFALENATSPEVKEFAQMMVSEHNEFLDRLREFAGEEAAASNESRRDEVAEGAASATESDGGIDLLAFKKELGEQCIATLKRELGAKQGPEFDRCYMGQQVGAHLHMWDSLTVLEKHASGEFKDLLAEGKETTEKHLKHAKQILKQEETKVASRSKADTTKE